MINRASTTDWDTLARQIEDVRGMARDFAAHARARFGRRLRDIRLYGSAARGDWREGSDVDVLVVLDDVRPPDREWIAETVTRLGVLGAGIPLATVTLSENQFNDLRQRERLFAREIDRDGLPL